MCASSCWLLCLRPPSPTTARPNFGQRLNPPARLPMDCVSCACPGPPATHTRASARMKCRRLPAANAPWCGLHETSETHARSLRNSTLQPHPDAPSAKQAGGKHRSNFRIGSYDDTKARESWVRTTARSPKQQCSMCIFEFTEAKLHGRARNMVAKRHFRTHARADARACGHPVRARASRTQLLN